MVYKLENYHLKKWGILFPVHYRNAPIENVTQTGQENVLYYMYLKPCDILFELFIDSISKI